MRKSFNKRISILMIILMLGLFTTGCIGNKSETLKQTESENLTQAEKIEDFEYLYKVIEENYPFLEVNKRVNGIDWIAKKNEFMEEVKKCKNDEEFIQKLGEIVGQLNNGHTHILNKNYYEYLFHSYECYLDGPRYKEISKPQALKRYGYNPDKKDIETQSESEKENLVEDNLETKIIDDNVAYMKIKSFRYFNIASDYDTIRSFINEIKSFDALIIDIRGNSGGVIKYWTEFIVPSLIEKSLNFDTYYFARGGEFTDEFFKLDGRLQIEKDKHLKELKELPSEVFTQFEYYYKDSIIVQPYASINFKGKIFLLVDKKVYSASETFAVFAKETGFATLIGERTGGDGIGGTGPAVCTLPNSGLVMRFSKEMGTTESGVCNEEMKTSPHYIVDAEITSDINDDKCIQKAIELVGK